MRLRPMPVVMVSTLTEQGAEITLRALELGAIDFVAKPRIGVSQGLNELATDIVDKIRVAAAAQVRRLATPAPAGSSATAGAPARAMAPLPRLSSTEKIICIGASTGGTEAIREVLMPMPADAPAIVITQHMPPGFTTSFANRLDGLCKIRVAEARDGERILPGHAYIAPGGRHLRIDRSGSNYVAVLEDTEPVNRHRPSVEVLFKSCARDERRRQLQLRAGRSELRGVRHAARGHPARRSARSAAPEPDRAGGVGPPGKRTGRCASPHLKARLRPGGSGRASCRV
jgi:two-component system chemotaxis response regulator CheB